MTLEERTVSIIDRVRMLDAQFGRAADTDYTDTHPRARLITDQPAIWKALIVPEYLANSIANPTNLQDDRRWDLFRLWAYGSPRVTAHLRDNEIAVRLYMPGAWERIFLVTNMPDLPAIIPGG